jgi:hypothetical protein
MMESKPVILRPIDLDLLPTAVGIGPGLSRKIIAVASSEGSKGN